MKLIEIIWERGNDFSGILECEHCGSYQFLDDGYHDGRYHNQVIPAIQCIDCMKRTNEEIPEGISDPGTSNGFKVVKKKVEVEQWAKVE